MFLYERREMKEALIHDANSNMCLKNNINDQNPLRWPYSSAFHFIEIKKKKEMWTKEIGNCLHSSCTFHWFVKVGTYLDCDFVFENPLTPAHPILCLNCFHTRYVKYKSLVSSCSSIWLVCLFVCVDLASFIKSPSSMCPHFHCALVERLILWQMLYE